MREDIRGACEILGLDPMYVANEGRFIAFVAPESAQQALEILRADSHGTGAVMIGEALDSCSGEVTVRTEIGGSRILDMLSGEQLPRIC